MNRPPKREEKDAADDELSRGEERKGKQRRALFKSAAAALVTMTSRNNIVMREHHYRAANPSMIMMEDKERRWSGRLRLNPKAPLVTPWRLHNHPVDEELRLLKKEASLWENEQQRVLGGEGGRNGLGRQASCSSVGRSVGKSDDCNLEIDLHIYGASKPGKQAPIRIWHSVPKGGRSRCPPCRAASV